MKDFYQTTVYINAITTIALKAIEDMSIGRMEWLNAKILEDAKTDIDGMLYIISNLGFDPLEKTIIRKVTREAFNSVQEHYEYCAQETKWLMKK